MNYLARLKHLDAGNAGEIFTHTPDNEPTKPTKPPFDGSVGTGTGHIENIFYENEQNSEFKKCAYPLPTEPSKASHEDALLADATTSWHWHIALPDREIEAYFNPEASFDKVMADYPDALAAEPLPERARRTASPQEAAELRQLITACATELVGAGRTVEGYGLLRTGYRDGWTAVEVEEALRVALADVDAALTCWRLLAPVNADEADQRN